VADVADMAMAVAGIRDHLEVQARDPGWQGTMKCCCKICLCVLGSTCRGLVAGDFPAEPIQC
jgi:hypothetical protein